MVGIAVDTTVPSIAAVALMSASANVTARRRAGSKRGISVATAGSDMSPPFSHDPRHGQERLAARDDRASLTVGVERDESAAGIHEQPGRERPGLRLERDPSQPPRTRRQQAVLLVSQRSRGGVEEGSAPLVQGPRPET